MTSPNDAERRAIQAIRDADPARILTSQDGYALTVGRLCELALSTSAPQGLAKYIGNRQPENTSPHSETAALAEPCQRLGCRFNVAQSLLDRANGRGKLSDAERLSVGNQPIPRPDLDHTDGGQAEWRDASEDGEEKQR